jgi:hypothetical protein|tara:strand:- start:712 stop:969 length:258 start_codon:yes stop_codon:yes gene_type:complete
MNIQLEAYVAQKNSWNAIFGGTPLDINSAEDRVKIADMIDCDLSPENLACDGEASPQHVRTQGRMLRDCARQLLAIDSTVTIYEL